MNQAYASCYSKNLERFYILDLQDMSGTEAAKNKAAYTREGGGNFLPFFRELEDQLVSFFSMQIFSCLLQ